MQRLNALSSKQEAERARDDAVTQERFALKQSALAKDAGKKAEDEARLANLAKQRAELLTQVAKSSENEAKAAKFLAEAKETAIRSTFKQIADNTAITQSLFAFELNLFDWLRWPFSRQLRLYPFVVMPYFGHAPPYDQII